MIKLSDFLEVIDKDVYILWTHDNYSEDPNIPKNAGNHYDFRDVVIENAENYIVTYIDQNESLEISIKYIGE